jgi:hypothetical protein
VFTAVSAVKHRLERVTLHRWARPRWLTVERVLLLLLGLGTMMPPETLFRSASLAGASRVIRRPWRSVGDKHWQIVSSEAESAELTDATEGTRGACPGGMVEVAGRMKAEPPGSTPIEEMQNTTCTSWLQREFPERCGAFDADRWRAVASDLPTTPMRFCIDRFEYPDVKGQFPVILVSWREAGAMCSAQGKRLCTENEWTFACEGEEAIPYPYGYQRDDSACPIDRPWIQYHEQAFADRSSELAMRELDNLWQGLASGASPRCRSAFGVYDMTGNVDEWTVAVRTSNWWTRTPGFKSVFKGGYWGPVRARCRSSTRVHDEDYVFYQQGFRCCASTLDQDGGSPESEPNAEDASAPNQDMLQPP